MATQCIRCKAVIASTQQGHKFTRESSTPVMLKNTRKIVPRHFWMCSRCFALFRRQAGTARVQPAA